MVSPFLFFPSRKKGCRAKGGPAQTMRKAQQAAPLQGLTVANFINENEKQVPRWRSE